MKATERLRVSEYLSTHPSHQKRITKIQEWMPEALIKREASNCYDVVPFLESIRNIPIW